MPQDIQNIEKMSGPCRGKSWLHWLLPWAVEHAPGIHWRTCPIKEISASTGSIEVRGGKICISMFQSGKKQTAESTIWREECWLKTWPRSSLKNLKAWRATLEGSISWLSRSFQDEFGMLGMLRMLQEFPGGSSQSRNFKIHRNKGCKGCKGFRPGRRVSVDASGMISPDLWNVFVTQIVMTHQLQMRNKRLKHIFMTCMVRIVLGKMM